MTVSYTKRQYLADLAANEAAQAATADQNACGGFTAFFARKSDMIKARTWLGKRCILAKAESNHGDNRLHVLIPPAINGAKLAENMAGAGFTFTHDLPR